MKKDEKPKRGGSRKGSGRKQKFNEETTTVSFRVPISLKPKIEAAVNKILTKALPQKISSSAL